MQIGSRLLAGFRAEHAHSAGLSVASGGGPLVTPARSVPELRCRRLLARNVTYVVEARIDHYDNQGHEGTSGRTLRSDLMRPTF